MDEVWREFHSHALKGIAVGLVVGLAFGILIGYVVLPPHLVTDQVQVSGIVKESQNGDITFANAIGAISTTVPIVNGQYSALVISGKSYNVSVFTGPTSAFYTFSLYIPRGVKNFTANF